MEGSSSQEGNLNALFKHICPLIRQLDEKRARANKLVDLFDDQSVSLRQELVSKCAEAIFDDQDCVSPKPREILWRKGYYDSISMAKRIVHKHNKSQAALDGAPLAGMDKLCAFIEEGISRLKQIIVRIEEDYNLDLKHLVDFSLFGDTEELALKLNHEEVPINKKITSLEILNFALESIHSLIVSLGDLHRYYLDFGLNKLFSLEITPQLTARFYQEAFKLNPKNGMPQNQLGTLWIGKNFNLDSAYHYLYSLICQRPFDLSEDNVAKIFQQTATYLENLVMEEDYQVTFRDFVARFLLIVDIFFFDKNVPTLNDLCRFLLCDLNCMLHQDDSGDVTQDVLFKFTAILFFCLRKLKRVNSAKVFQLNAFLAAICDQFVESCNGNFEEFFAVHSDENEEYQMRYQELFQKDRRQSEETKKFIVVVPRAVEEAGKLNGVHRTFSTSTAEGVSQDAYQGGSSNENKSSGDRGQRNARGVNSNEVAKKKTLKYRRRRRRSTYTSDSDLTSNFDSDSERSEEASDFSDVENGESDDDEENFDSEEEENNFDGKRRNVQKSDDDSDVVIEEETLVMRKETNNGTRSPQTSESAQFHSQSPKNDILGDFKELHIQDENVHDDQVEGKDRQRAKACLLKYSPNLLLKFVETEPTIRALKLLLDWLMDNKEIIWECYQSNPEFVHKIMALLNAVNVNIFTRRIFFDRQLLTVAGLREDVRSLFDARTKLPIEEDVLMKHFGEFVRAQAHLDWESPSIMKVSPMEENLLRIVKLKNFGFFVCDRKKFGYAFRNCRFELIDPEQLRKKKKAKKGSQQQSRSNGWTSGSGSGENRRERRRRQRKQGNGDVIPTGGERGRNGRGITGEGDKLSGRSAEGARQKQQQRRNRGKEEGNGDAKAKDGLSRQKEMLKKGELMGRLWLRNEVKTLESKIRSPKGMGLLTPYVVVDTKALVQHLAIVRHFVRMEKFIVLIPTGVLTELDSLKVSNERARECIRWLDRTISQGSPFLRTQEGKEKLQIGNFVKPRQGPRTEITSFFEIAEFCNYLGKKHEIDGQPGDVLTLLTGEDLELTLEGDLVEMLRAIPVKFDRIDKFYGKLIKK